MLVHVTNNHPIPLYHTISSPSYQYTEKRSRYQPNGIVIYIIYKAESSIVTKGGFNKMPLHNVGCK